MKQWRVYERWRRMGGNGDDWDSLAFFKTCLCEPPFHSTDRWRAVSLHRPTPCRSSGWKRTTWNAMLTSVGHDIIDRRQSRSGKTDKKKKKRTIDFARQSMSLVWRRMGPTRDEAHVTQRCHASSFLTGRIVNIWYLCVFSRDNKNKSVIQNRNLEALVEWLLQARNWKRRGEGFICLPAAITVRENSGTMSMKSPIEAYVCHRNLHMWHGDTCGFQRVLPHLSLSFYTALAPAIFLIKVLAGFVNERIEQSQQYFISFRLGWSLLLLGGKWLKKWYHMLWACEADRRRSCCKFD